MESIDKIKEVFVATSREIASDFQVQKLTSGHINKTYLVTNAGEQLVLQELNTQVFENIEGITQNILKISQHLIGEEYPNKTIELIAFKDAEYLYENKWRIMPFIEGTKTFLKVQSTKQAYEAAKFLSYFHAHLLNLSADQVQDSIQGFLDFNKRLEQYHTALILAEEPKLIKASAAIEFLSQHQNILEDWLELLPQIPTRVIHADPKISNFLFDKTDSNKILALIDWDTFMRGSILYDFGDMVRSYTNLKEEDDPEVGNNFSLENYKALEEGFLFYLKETLTKKEVDNLDLGAKVVIYVQAIRFLTDFLNGDVYYAVSHSEQNLDRAMSQINLLKGLLGLINLEKKPKGNSYEAY